MITPDFKLVSIGGKENPDKYSLLITDDKMADMDGLFLSTKLLEVNPKLHVILFSEFSDLQGNNYEFNILKKPVSISKLISTVNYSIVRSMLLNKKSKVQDR